MKPAKSTIPHFDPIQKHADKILQSLTLEQKVSLCHGSGLFTVGPIEDLGVPVMWMTDGPHGIREEQKSDGWGSAGQNDDEVTALPAEVCLAATWDKELATQYGETLGREARSRGKDIVLGPGVNIHRTPFCGRNFEYYSEDPCLTSRMAVNVIKGIQSMDVAACVKHYALNNQELDRHGVNVKVDERALHEIFLPAFFASVTEADVLSIMGSYNKYKDHWCCHNPILLQEILKEKWGFKGAVISDWGGCHVADEAARYGLDLEMGGDLNNHHLDKPFLKGLQDGTYSESMVNDKARRVLYVMLRLNLFEPEKRPRGERNTSRHQQIARKVAIDGMVLLKNQSLLPLSKKEIKKLVVIGPGADKLHCARGGSAGVKSLYEITPVRGIQDFAGKDVEVTVFPDLVDNTQAEPIPSECLSIAEETSGIRGWKMSFNGKTGDHKELPVKPLTDASFTWNGDSVLPEWPENDFRLKIESSFSPQQSGVHRFLLTGNLWTALHIDGKKGNSTTLDTPETVFLDVELEAGKNIHLEVMWHPSKPGSSFELKYIPPNKLSAFEMAAGADIEANIKEADAVVYIGGMSHDYEGEGRDRHEYGDYLLENRSITKFLKLNPNFIVVLNGGNPMSLPWIDEASAVLMAWYGGMEAGNALAQVLFGEVNPSGKLPVTWARELTDYSSHQLGEYKAEKCEYKEGLLVGYRYFDTEKSEPLFPFGHGLSYTSFEFSGLLTEVIHHPDPKNGDQTLVRIGFHIQNTGELEGAETAQVYIQPVNPKVFRPFQELKEFHKVFLKPDEKQNVNLDLPGKAFSFYNPKTGQWQTDPGRYRIRIGSSSRDILLEQEIVLE